MLDPGLKEVGKEPHIVPEYAKLNHEKTAEDLFFDSDHDTLFLYLHHNRMRGDRAFLPSCTQ